MYRNKLDYYYYIEIINSFNFLDDDYPNITSSMKIIFTI